jgi:hypothetical protein
LSGCASQISALTPVGGDDIASVRTAAVDVLLAQDVVIIQAPTCTKSDTAITCAGTSTNDVPIDVEAPLAAADTMTMTLTVGDKVLYAGSVQDILDRAARGE